MNGALVSADRGGVFDMSLQAPIARPRLRERRCDVQETDPPAVATRSTARVAFRRRGEHLRPLPRAASQLKCGGVGDFPAEDLNAGFYGAVDDQPAACGPPCGSRESSWPETVHADRGASKASPALKIRVAKSRSASPPAAY